MGRIDTSSETRDVRPFQFTLRSLLVAMTIWAVVLSLGSLVGFAVFGAIVTLYAVVMLITLVGYLVGMVLLDGLESLVEWVFRRKQSGLPSGTAIDPGQPAGGTGRSGGERVT